MNLRETGYTNLDWIQLARHMTQWLDLVNTVNEPVSSVKGRYFIDQLRDYKLPKKDCHMGLVTEW
jgi:hypothetical protein